MKTPRINLSIYADVLRVREAWRFDVACVLIRCLQYIFTIGIIGAMTLAGYSSLAAGVATAVACLSSFFITPRTSKLIDQRGQAAVVPWLGLLAGLGVAVMCVGIVGHLPLWVCYLGAALLGFTPNGPSLARTRWSYLVETGKFGAGGLSIRTVYAYEGVLEDTVFMLAPAISLALSALLFPSAGLVFGGVAMGLGVAMLCSATATAPLPGWEATTDGDTSDQNADEAAAKHARLHGPDSAWDAHPERSVFRLSPTVRVLFCCMVLLGIFYGSFDNACVSFCQEIGRATLASPVIALDGIISAIAGMVFGTLTLKSTPVRTLVITGILIGLGYFTNGLVSNVFTLFLFTAVAAPFYAPFFITVNTVVERAIPSARLTEGIAWVNTGTTLGFAIGPTAAGALIDAFGGLAGFKLVAAAAILIPVVILLFRGTLRRELGE